MNPRKELQYKITIEEIKEFKPCYEPETKLGEKWSGTLIDILKMKDVSPEDKFWAVSWFAGDKVNRMFAVYCARQALMLVENPDPRSVAACDIAEKFALGQSTKEELDAARDAASDAAWAAEMDAASDAARAAASDTAWDAARDAAMSAARSAASDAAWDAQIDFLIQMIGDEIK
jgi:hypothetical protein